MGFWDFLADRQTLILRIERLEDRLKNRNAIIDRSQDLAARERERELAEARGLILSLQAENQRMTIKLLDLHKTVHALQEDNRKLEEQGQDFAQETVEGRLRIEQLEGQVATLNDELSDVMRQRDECHAHNEQLVYQLGQHVAMPAPVTTKRGGRRTKKSEVITGTCTACGRGIIPVNAAGLCEGCLIEFDRVYKGR